MGNELLKVQGKRFKQPLEATWVSGGEEPATDLPLDIVRRPVPVNLLRRTGAEMDLCRDVRR